MTLPADGTIFAFFRADSPLSVHCFDCSSVSGVKWWTYVSSMVMNQCKKSALLLWNIAKHSIEISLRHCFYSIVSKRDTHLAHSFLMSKFSINMRCKALSEKLAMFASLFCIIALLDLQPSNNPVFLWRDEGEFCYKMKNLYLFIQINFIPFKAITSRYNALMSTFFPIVETPVKFDFRNCLQSLLRFGLYLFNRVKTVFTEWSFEFGE